MFILSVYIHIYIYTYQRRHCITPPPLLHVSRSRCDLLTLPCSEPTHSSPPTIALAWLRAREGEGVKPKVSFRP